MNNRACFSKAIPAVVLCTGGLVLSAAPANAVHAPDHLYALEVFAPEGEPVTQASCGQPVAVPGMADAAELPTGTTAAIDLEGPLQEVTGDGTCRTWWIGGYPVAAPFSGAPTITPGTVVRVVGAAEVAPTTTIVASRIRAREEAGVGPAELALAYHAPFTITDGDLVVDVPGTGDCLEVPDDVWTVQEEGASGGLWQLDVAAARSAGDVEPCFRAGDAIEAEFDLVPPEPEAGGGTLTGLPGGQLPLLPALPVTDQVTGDPLAALTGEQSPLSGVAAGAPDSGGLASAVLGELAGVTNE